MVKITDWDGDAPGLTELEAFETEIENPLRFIKLTDECENFIYDYIIESGDKTKLSLYSYNAPELSTENYRVDCDNKKCLAAIESEMIVVACPKGESCMITVTSKDGFSDSARVSNPKNKKILKKAIDFDKYHHRVLKSHKQKVYYKKMLLHFYDELMWKIKRTK